MKIFDRSYPCRSDGDDRLSVHSVDDEPIIHVGCKYGSGDRSEVFVHLNSEQVANLIELLTEWNDTVPDDERDDALWKDN